MGSNRWAITFPLLPQSHQRSRLLWMRSRLLRPIIQDRAREDKEGKEGKVEDREEGEDREDVVDRVDKEDKGAVVMEETLDPNLAQVALEHPHQAAAAMDTPAEDHKAQGSTQARVRRLPRHQETLICLLPTTLKYHPHDQGEMEISAPSRDTITN